jgi:hypothetical protein
MNSRRNGDVSHKSDIKTAALQRAAANNATGAGYYWFAKLRSPRSKAGNYSVCRCLIEMSQRWVERCLTSDCSRKNAVEHRQQKQAFKGPSEPLAAKRCEDAKDDQA